MTVSNTHSLSTVSVIHTWFGLSPYPILSYIVAPIVEQDPTDVSVVAPDPVTLMCTAIAKPLPEIVWIKEANGTHMEYSESENGLEVGTVQSTTLTTSTLTIDPTNLTDTANYLCVARNLLGNTTSKPAEVTVFSE